MNSNVPQDTTKQTVFLECSYTTDILCFTTTKYFIKSYTHKFLLIKKCGIVLYLKSGNLFFSIGFISKEVKDF